MAITAGQISDKISELRSKIAVWQHLISLLTANYMSATDAAAELKLPRDDGATVTPLHFDAALDDLNQLVSKARDDLETWSSLVFDEAETREVETPKVPETKKVKNEPGKAIRGNQHRAASK